MKPEQSVVPDDLRFAAGHEHDVGITVVVEIADGDRVGCGAREPCDRLLAKCWFKRRRRLACFGQRRRARIEKHSGAPCGSGAGDEQIEVAILIEIDPGHARGRTGDPGQSGRLRNVCKPATIETAEQGDRPGGADGRHREIVPAVVVEVAHRDRRAVCSGGEPGRGGSLFEPRRATVGGTIHIKEWPAAREQEQVEAVVTIGIQRHHRCAKRGFEPGECGVGSGRRFSRSR